MDALKLMIPDDQVGIAVVDLWNGGPAALHMSGPPLDVPAAAHERRHRSLQIFRLLLRRGGRRFGDGNRRRRSRLLLTGQCSVRPAGK